MKPIFIFRHLECEGPGYLEQVLQRYDLPYSLICIDRKEAVPQDITDCSALVFMGGPMSVNDDLPWIEQECQLIRRAVDQDMPVLGHCLGGQMISKALGGKVRSNPVKEIGWHPVKKLRNKAADKWLSRVPRQFLAFHWHGETFSIPTGAVEVMESDYCKNQAFTIGNTLALQFHVEMTVEMVREWSTLYTDEIVEPTDTIQSAYEMVEDIDKKVADLQQIADQLYYRWLRPLI